MLSSATECCLDTWLHQFIYDAQDLFSNDIKIEK